MCGWFGGDNIDWWRCGDGWISRWILSTTSWITAWIITSRDEAGDGGGIGYELDVVAEFRWAGGWKWSWLRCCCWGSRGYETW